MIGTEFEKDLSKEFSIDRVPGSGNQWHSKLDLKGFGFRWSLKATAKKSISINQDVIDEAVTACYGTGGDMSIPIWAFRIGSEEYDMIMLRKEDFKMLQEKDEKKIIYESSGSPSVQQRRLKAMTPKLLRDE